MEDRKYYYTDPESGEYIKITKECFDKLNCGVHKIHYDKDGFRLGSMLLMSTTDDLRGRNNYQELWKKL